MNDDNSIASNNHDVQYFTMIPRYVWARCNDVYELSLYHVMKMIAGEGGCVCASTATLASLSMMSHRKVMETRKSLLAKGLITGGQTGSPGARIWHIDIVDVWSLNVDWSRAHRTLKSRAAYKASPAGDAGVPQHEMPAPQQEVLPKNTLKENLEPESTPLPHPAGVVDKYHTNREEPEHIDLDAEEHGKTKTFPKWTVPELPIHHLVLNACGAKRFAYTRLKATLNGIHKQLTAFQALEDLEGRSSALTTCMAIIMGEQILPCLMPQSWVTFKLEHAKRHHWSVEGTIKAIEDEDGLLKHCKFELRQIGPVAVPLARENLDVEEL